MSTRGSNRKPWTRRVLAIIISSLSLLASLGLTAAPAGAAPGGKKATTTTTTPGTTSTTTPTSKGGGGGGAKLTAVVSLSRHRLLATYDRDLDPAALQVSSYAFSSSQAVNLAVTAVVRASNNQVFVLTSPQQPVTYEVTLPRTPRPLTFTGSTVAEPQLLSAKALSRTQIVVKFSEPLGPAALQSSSYSIMAQGSTATLAVNGATLFGSTQTEALLTTAPQEALPYVLRVGDIQGASGTYMDPTANSGQFTGSTVPPGPWLLNATPNGDAELILSFDAPLSPSAADPSLYTGTPNLFIQSATLQSENRHVVLKTSTQYQIAYSIAVKVTGVDGSPVNPAFNSLSFTGTGAAINNERPRVVSAASTGNKSVMVQFSKPMADNTADPSRFAIAQTTVHPEVGTLVVQSAEFVDGARLSVRLTTSSQAEVTYQVTAHNVTDLMGNPLADKTRESGVTIDPTSFTFAGTPPSACPTDALPGTCEEERVDTDGDGVFDHEETRGWQVTVTLANGQLAKRDVTSNPFRADTDADGLTDYQEKVLIIDARDNDSDDDELTDFAEFNEIFSDPTIQDSDGDGLYDGVEVNFFRTSAILDDTDGDQLLDGVEITLSNRNPRVADLPKPTLEIGSMNLDLDVRFVDTVGGEDTVVDSTTASGTLVQSAKKEFSNSNTGTIEAGLKVGYKQGLAVEAGTGGIKGSASFESSQEVSYGGSFTTNFTEASSAETTNSYEKSLTTTKERTASASQTREVQAARMTLSVMLKTAGDIAFTIRNLQVTAHIQDPQNPDRLTPLGTLVPEEEPATGYNLGPLVPVRGPVVFKVDTLFPMLVEDLMRNPRGVVFRFANYDITDEKGRNFAFTSQDVNDRTARLVIDYGSFDRDSDGQGDYSEIFRVSTGTGRRVVDTNGDNVIDAKDRIMVYDPNGKHMGISLREALQAIGLTEYNETEKPTGSLTQAEIDKSYSVIQIPNVGERIFRVRRPQRGQAGEAKEWQIITASGIDRNVGLDDIIMTAGHSVNLSFVQDVDLDNLTGAVERLNNCSDGSKDSDGDSLDDRYEVLIGWTVDSDLGQHQARSRCASKDTDNDGLTDPEEAHGVIETQDGLVRLDAGHEPRRRSANTFHPASQSEMLAIPACSPTLTTGCALPGDLAIRSDSPGRMFILTNNQPSVLASWVRLSTDLSADDAQAVLARAKLADPVTDPSTNDTDGDSLADKHEGTPHTVKLHDGTTTEPLISSSELFDTDLDTASDGLEERIGGDPTVKDLDNFLDSDGDGLTNTEEKQGWKIATEAVSTLPARCDSVCSAGAKKELNVTSDPNVADTDGDGLNDGEERNAVRGTSTGIDPRNVDTDGDGLADLAEVKGFTLDPFGILKTDPGDADTDDDKRSDGAEAKQAITVRVVGEPARQVISNPMSADADLDRLVDGDEELMGRPWKGEWQSGTNYLINDVVSHLGTRYVANAPSSNSAPPSGAWALLSSMGGTDPNKDNTDGDTSSDYAELDLKRDPLLPDLRVSVSFTALQMTKDGEPGGDSGDFQFEFKAVGPNGTKDAVRWITGTDSTNYSSNVASRCGSGVDPPCWANYSHNNVDYPVVHIFEGSTLVFPNGGITVDLGTVSTTDKQPEKIEISGYLYERDGSNHSAIDCDVIVPGSQTIPSTGGGVVLGTNLKPGTNAMPVHRLLMCPAEGDELDFTLMVTYTAV